MHIFITPIIDMKVRYEYDRWVSPACRPSHNALLEELEETEERLEYKLPVSSLEKRLARAVNDRLK
jgi:hypothetical protein